MKEKFRMLLLVCAGVLFHGCAIEGRHQDVVIYDRSDEIAGAVAWYYESTPAFGRVTAQMRWAAEVWHGIKKHWVLEIQNLIQAQNSVQHDA